MPARMSELDHWPAAERPRERILCSGPEVMTDSELLALVLGSSSRGSGGVLQTARRVLVDLGGLEGLGNCGPGELMQVPGIGEARASALCAATELARRLGSSALLRGDAIRCAEDAYLRVRSRLSMLRQEVFIALALDGRHRVLALRRVAQGSATCVEVHPREVFGPAVRAGAAAAIVAHNHPSGDPEPSGEDLDLTLRLQRAGDLMGIPLLDHLVVGAGGYVSLAERGEL